jgi:hypothetical protein
MIGDTDDLAMFCIGCHGQIVVAREHDRIQELLSPEAQGRAVPLV